MTECVNNYVQRKFWENLRIFSKLKFTVNQMMRTQLLGKSSGLLLQEKHWHNCDCVKVEVVSVVRLHVDDKILLWWLARLQDIKQQYICTACVCMFNKSAAILKQNWSQQNDIVNCIINYVFVSYMTVTPINHRYINNKISIIDVSKQETFAGSELHFKWSLRFHKNLRMLYGTNVWFQTSECLQAGFK